MGRYRFGVNKWVAIDSVSNKWIVIYLVSNKWVDIDSVSNKWIVIYSVSNKWVDINSFLTNGSSFKSLRTPALELKINNLNGDVVDQAHRLLSHSLLPSLYIKIVIAGNAE